MELTYTYLNLTPRQREVVYWVSEGLSNQEVAEKLVVQPCVVAGHLTPIYDILSVEFERTVNRPLLIRHFAVFFHENPSLIPIRH
jgi:DNA-binding NarL/FixJ family response regulator